ncbi:hypothetical protein [Luteolibacter sp. LG18]|uniref:hypothetical protein n=1 Tax=Luteolibacter sp. LG18 TaxID=2819286 RepID=UPI002B2C7E04|nr:hypothetical protein llg_01470 [Luteolibacter sp. LG18]
MKIATTLIATVLALPLAASAKDGGLTLEQIPAKAAAAIQAAAGKEAVKIEAEKEDGTESYEAKWTAGGTKHEISVTADGTVLLREDVIALEAAPAPVQEAIKKVAAAGKLEKVEQETGKKYTGTVYEAEIKTAEGKLEVKFDATGKEIERETEKEKEDEEKEDGEKDDDDNK